MFSATLSGAALSPTSASPVDASGGIAMGLPVVFVGSSVEQLPLVTNLLVALEYKAVVKLWTDAFAPGVTTLDGLMAHANEADFALFVFGPDDWTESRAIRSASPRDNVVFEAGLFGGILGWKRSIIVHAKGVKLPSDLLGLTLISYNGGGDAEREAQLVAAKVGEVITKRGWRGSESFAGQMQGHWWQFTLSGAIKIERSVLSLLEIRRTGSGLTLSGRAWTDAGELIARFWSKAVAVNEQSRQLFYYWEGDWPGQPNAPEFFGKGEIVLDDASHGSGYFTIRSDSDNDPRERKSVMYQRATPVEVEAANSDDVAKRRELIQQQLKKRRDFQYTGGPAPEQVRGSASP